MIKHTTVLLLCSAYVAVILFYFVLYRFTTTSAKTGHPNFIDPKNQSLIIWLREKHTPQKTHADPGAIAPSLRSIQQANDDTDMNLEGRTVAHKIDEPNSITAEASQNWTRSEGSVSQLKDKVLHYPVLHKFVNDSNAQKHMNEDEKCAKNIMKNIPKLNVSSGTRAVIQKLKPAPENFTQLLRGLGKVANDFFLHTTELETILQICGQLREPSLPENADKMVFMIMAGSVKKGRMQSKVDTYAHGVKNFFAFSDIVDASKRMITLPDLAGKPEYKWAQKRVAMGMRWLYYNETTQFAETADWFAIGDDDTWYNVPALLKFLSKFDPLLPLGFNYYWNHTFGAGAISSGGAGIVLSKAAFIDIASRILTPECPHASLMGLTINKCMVKYGILKIQDARFHFHKHANALSRRNVRGDIVDQFSYHYVNDLKFLSQITCYVADVYNMPNLRAKNCNYDWEISNNQ